MADGNTLHIVNYFPVAVDATISDTNFNCCDAPKPGNNIGLIQPGGTAAMFYVRTDGHGCNGRQGQFTMSLNGNNSVFMNFDGGGGMAPIQPSGGFGAWLAQNSDNSYTLIVGPTPTA